MLPRRNLKHSIKLFQRPPLRLWQAEVTKHPPEDIPCGVPAKRAFFREGGYKGWPGERKDEVETPAICGRKGHSDVADVERLWDVSFGEIFFGR